jgi:hypothetical protein
MGKRKRGGFWGDGRLQARSVSVVREDSCFNFSREKVSGVNFGRERTGIPRHQTL